MNESIVYKETGKPIIWERPRRKMINICHEIKMNYRVKPLTTSTDFMELESIKDQPLICLN